MVLLFSPLQSSLHWGTKGKNPESSYRRSRPESDRNRSRGNAQLFQHFMHHIPRGLHITRWWDTDEAGNSWGPTGGPLCLDIIFLSSLKALASSMKKNEWRWLFVGEKEQMRILLCNCNRLSEVIHLRYLSEVISERNIQLLNNQGFPDLTFKWFISLQKCWAIASLFTNSIYIKPSG